MIPKAWKQQVKGWIIGGVTGWASTQFGMTAEQAIPIGVFTGAAVDFLYWLMMFAGRKR